MKISEVLGEQNRFTRKQFVGQSLLGAWVIALLTFSGYTLHFNAAPVGFLFLLVVVCEAILAGFWQASIVSVLACSCLDYFFYPPLFHFTIANPQDWVALGAFEISALLVSRLSSRERLNSFEAQLQRTSMEQLYELSRSTLLINMHEQPGPQIAQLIQRIFNTEAVTIYDANSGTCDSAGAWRENEQELARRCFVEQTEGEYKTAGIKQRVLRAGANSVGAIVVKGNLGSLVADALASLTAIALDRCVSFEKESSIEAAHQAERLRAAVLDSLAHAVKTPLTAISTASAGLGEVGILNQAQHELVELIEDESSKLSELSTRLLQTAKLEAEKISVAQDEIPVGELVQMALEEQQGRMTGHPVEVAVPDPSLTIRGDKDLLSMALAQFLDNAAKYSFAGTAVKIAANRSHSEVLLSVHNFGPTIPISDREKIFQRFYRSEGTVQLAAGTGIGLSTVKMAAEAHRGHAWVISDAHEGTTFFLALPHDRGDRERGERE
ncbi:MAG: ATP-binding protein [Terracidiphilus sp.]|jgi:two-component system sensor histidine kinase KdpD